MGAVTVGIIANEAGDHLSDVFALGQRVTFGAYAENEPWPDLSAHYALEEQMGVRFPTMSWFLAFDSGWLPRQAAAAAATGHDLLICWQPNLSNRQPVPFADILAGVWDRRMDAFFRQAATYPNRVTIRFAHEMNLGQLSTSIVNANPSTRSLDVWLDTWRYVVDRQRRFGGNVTWQWCVNSLDMGGVAAESYWPGADYVDSIGIDSYNGFGPWTPAVKIIKPMYDRVCALDPTAPIWISEVGCRSAQPGETYDKAAWFNDFLTTSQFPRLSTISFFNSRKEHDWRITTDDVRAQLGSLLQSQRQVRR